MEWVSSDCTYICTWSESNLWCVSTINYNAALIQLLQAVLNNNAMVQGNTIIGFQETLSC